MKSISAIVGVVFTLLITSCSQNRFVVAPQYTDVTKISSLKKGMSLTEVNTTLGIPPFDMYVSDNGVSMYTYNYRLKFRRIPVNNQGTFIDRPTDPAQNSINSEEAQKFGTDFYDIVKQLYVSFKDEKLQSVITQDGLDNATKVMAISGSLAEIMRDPQFKVLPDALLNSNVVVPLDEKGNYIPNNGTVVNGTGSVGPGFIYMGGNNIGVATIPGTYPRVIKNTSRKATFDFLRKKKNRGSSLSVESDF